MKPLRIIATMVAALLVGPYLLAATYTMGYTPAGGVTVNSAGGPPYTINPALFTYTNFNSSAYQALYYGVNYVANVAMVGSPTGNMTFLGTLANGSLVWASSQNWQFTGGVCSVNTATQLIMQVQQLTGTPGFISSGALNGASTTKGTLGITTGNPSDPLFQVVSAGNFQVTFQFLTWDGTQPNLGTGSDLQSTFANCNGGTGGAQFQTSVDFEFWWSIAKTTAKTLVVGICKTNSQSYGDIATAVAAAPAGAVVQICPGTYQQQLTLTQAVTLQGIAYGADQAVVLVPPQVFEANGSLGPISIYAQILVQDASPVNISGLTIDGNNSGCPSGAIAGIVYLSSSSPSSGKVTNSVIRNTGNGCNAPAIVGLYAQNNSGSASSLTLQGNSIHSINGGAVVYGANQGGIIASNTIDQTTSGLMFQQAGPSVSVTSNNLTSVQDGISLNSATGVVATGNRIVNSSDKAINLQDSSSGGNNNVTRNTIDEANCGISVSGAATSDTFLPNTIQNSALATCQ